MLTRHRNTIVAGTAALAVLAGGGAAIAATGVLSPKEESDAVLADAAEQLGVEPSELTEALKEALKNRVDAAVEDGRLTEAEGAEMKERIDSGEVPLFGLGPRLHGPHFAHSGFDAAESYLGMTEAEVRTALGNGKTLADLARERDKSVDGLVAAMVADAKEELDEAVDDGRLTESQSKAIQEDMQARITDLVNGELPKRLGPPPGFPRGEASLERAPLGQVA
jgi:polyhydroxyalkanoate synthesis regulator phasin